MNLDRVTFTGVDDETSVNEMVKISSEFGFVEWGVLVGSGTGGRFPSHLTFERLRDIDASYYSLSLSLHLCGKWLRQVANEGRFALVDSHLSFALPMFNRCQLNFHGDDWPDATAEKINVAFQRLPNPAVIFQMDGVNDHLFSETAELADFPCHALFDLSHGAGVVPEFWQQNFSDEYCGYAGGLGPHNLRDQLQQIDLIADDSSPIWIDMETHVRTDGRFDLDKVRACCEIATEFVAYPVGD